MKDLELQAMPTPNPNSIKFLLNVEFLAYGSLNFDSKEKAETSPLAKKIFEIEGMQGVMVGTNFVSIIKTEEAGWENILEDATNIIKNMIESEETLLDKKLIEDALSKKGDDSEIVTKIKHILDTEIRPAIAMDGGDCAFQGYDKGIVTLELQGACSSCPSSVMTLKMGIENRLREEIPEVLEVVQV